MPLRLKLLIAVIVLVFAGLAVADVVTYTSLRSFLIKRVDQQLVAAQGPMVGALNQAAGQIGPGPGGNDHDAVLPPGTFGEVRDASGKVVVKTTITYGEPAVDQPKLPAALQRLAGSTPFTVGSTGGSSEQYRVLTGTVSIGPDRNTGTLIVAIPLSEVARTTGRLLLVEAIVTLAVVFGLGFLSWWLVRRELRPLDEIGATAGAIAAGDLSQRVPNEDPRTEIGRLSIALNAMLAQIEQAFAERKASEDRLRRFLADASHELRTPLTSIRGYAELFRRGADRNEGDLAKSMRRIEDESARMGIMVEDLLLLARLDQDRPLERKEVDLSAVAADSVQDARAADPGREITLEAAGAVTVVGDEARLRQVMANLLANALVHTPPGTPVAVRALRNESHAVLEVADRGQGLTPEEAQQAFEPFFRSDPSRDRTTGGAGLGLAIVAAIAKAHGGSVEVAETNGGGATFRVLLPAEASPNDEAGVDASEPTADTRAR
jgi:two-component system OmpR family sensor kinase